MSRYPVHTLANAPEPSKAALEQLQKAFGFLPNIAGAIASSPTLMNSLASVFACVHSGSFSEAEIQVCLLTNAVTNASSWAVAFHTTLALQVGIDSEDVQNIRQGKAPVEPKLAALSIFAKALIEKRGHVFSKEVAAFVNGGYTQEQALEAIAISAASTITNYAGTLTDPPLETQFQQHSWTPIG
jgi:alkylhydroperoxidase family enzyme